MILYNYTSLKQRDTKIYNIGGYNLTGGISVNFLTVVGPAFLATVLIGALIGLPFGVNFINPFSAGFHGKYTFIWCALGIGIGCALWYVQFSGYRLYQYLIAYFKPKAVYHNDFKHTRVKFTNVKIDAFVKNIL